MLNVRFQRALLSFAGLPPSVVLHQRAGVTPAASARQQEARLVGIVRQSAGSVQLRSDVRGGPSVFWGFGFLRLQRLSRSPNARIRDPFGSCGSAMPIYLKRK